MRWYKAAKLIIAVNTLAISHGAVGTVGIVKTTTEAVNTIVGTAWFKYNCLRCLYEELDTIEAEFREIAQDISAEGMTFSIDRIWECPPLRFDKIAISCVRAAGEGHSGKDM